MTWNIEERKLRLRALYPLATDAEIAIMAANPVLHDGEGLSVPLMMMDRCSAAGAFMKDSPMNLNDSLEAVPSEFKHKFLYIRGGLNSGNPLIMEDAARQAGALVSRMRMTAGGIFPGMMMDSGEKVALTEVANHLEGMATATRQMAAEARARSVR
ncbi:hypothetical protein OPKNFCMD_5470 [Methylobacterium crusticola]|uniref:Uncharacterized protein n=1 Tax=Methylobacterium crusticola TaxID=1697972 RepID=A0ABQ4R6C7_9HYPH|nr:hypothetical protein [Methylobacterium crusticola]GJD52704.1 hypothetical protein OPKNFCMD_5470 [Methylobacterium crusticola]